MSITGTLMVIIFAYRKAWIKMVFAIFSGTTSFIFFTSCLLKIPHGGYWSLLIASVPLGLIILYTEGQKRLYSSFLSVDKDEFLKEYKVHYTQESHIEGTALFFARKKENIPAYIPKTMFQNGIIYERNVIVKMKPTNEPLGVTCEFSNLAPGLSLLVIFVGYMEVFNMEDILKSQDINERTIFYGDEEIVSHSIWWKLYAFIKDMSPSFVSFYNFPSEKLIGVSRRAEI